MANKVKKEVSAPEEDIAKIEDKIRDLISWVKIKNSEELEEGEGKNPFRQQQVNALIRVGAEQRDVAKALRTLAFDVENMKSQETT